MNGGQRPRSLRAQLILGSVAVVAVTFTALALLLAALLGHYFAAGRANALGVRVRAAAQLLRLAPAAADPRLQILVRDTGGHLWVIGPDGRVLRAFGPGRFGPYTDWINPSELRDVLAGHALTRLADGGAGAGRRPSAVVVAVPAFRVRGLPARQRAAVVWAAPVGGTPLLWAIATRVLAAALLGLALAAALFAWLAGRVAAPIRRLERVAGRIAAGTFEAAVAGPDLRPAGPAEVASLAGSLREMALRLHDLDRRRRAFLADVSHELRSPLAALRGALAGLTSGSGSSAPADRARALEVALGETERLGRLVDDLLVLARSEAARLELRRQPVDLHENVLRVALSLEPLASAAGVAFRFAPPDGSTRVDADPDRLAQVVWNLLDNAVRHTPAGAEALVAVRGTGEGVRLEVANPGRPIPPESVARLFERFERGEGGSDGGTGLGLAIARTLAVAHGARIEAEAPAAGGLRVIVIWPAASG